jgi:hypothetical protein
MGRPTEYPKPYQIGIRIGPDEKAILDAYCEQEGVSQAKAVRIGIGKLKADIKK